MSRFPVDATAADPSRGRWPNLLGAAASGLCAIHCAAAPLVVAARPVLAKAAPHTTAEVWDGLDFVFLSLSLLAVWLSSRHSADARLRAALWLAWGLFAAGIVCEHSGLEAGEWLMYLGSIALVALHGAKLWALRRAGEGRATVEQTTPA